MSNIFVEGDLVQLRSGGVRMTVEQVETDLVHCVWKDKNQTTQREQFKAATLMKYDNKPGSTTANMKRPR